MIELPNSLEDTNSLLWFLATFSGHSAFAGSASQIAPAVSDAILEENGGIILQENSDDILQQA